MYNINSQFWIIMTHDSQNLVLHPDMTGILLKYSQICIGSDALSNFENFKKNSWTPCPGWIPY